MKSFSDKVVLITGASSGIGKALAEEFFEQGAILSLCARRTDRINQLADFIKQKGGQALATTCDVCQTADLEKAVQQTLQTFGRLDIVVANAGFGVVGSFLKLNLEDYQRQFETNVFGVLRTAYASFPSLKEAKGQLVIIGSVNSYLSFRGVSAYAMSKFSVRALSESLWHEFKNHGVGVTLICPGYVESEIRQVDNQGKWHAKSAADAPKLLRMSSRKAARQILKAVQKRKREQIITFHAKLGIFLQRHFPNLLHFLFGVFRVRGRRAP